MAGLPPWKSDVESRGDRFLQLFQKFADSSSAEFVREDCNYNEVAQRSVASAQQKPMLDFTYPK